MKEQLAKECAEEINKIIRDGKIYPREFSNIILSYMNRLEHYYKGVEDAGDMINKELENKLAIAVDLLSHCHRHINPKVVIGDVVNNTVENCYLNTKVRKFIEKNQRSYNKMKRLPRNGVKANTWIGNNGKDVWATTHKSAIKNPCRIFSEARSNELLDIEKKWKKVYVETAPNSGLYKAWESTYLSKRNTVARIKSVSTRPKKGE